MKNLLKGDFFMAQKMQISSFSNLKTAINLERALIGKKIQEHNRDKSAHSDLISRINKLEFEVDNLTAGTFSKIINALPIQDGRLIYDGSPQSPSWIGYDPNKLSLGGTVLKSAAGTYSAIFIPINGYTWRDGSTDSRIAKWKIFKTENFVILRPDTKIFQEGESVSFYADRFGSGKISAVSTDENIVVVQSVENNIVTVKGLKSGEATVAIYIDEDTNYKKTLPVKFDAVVTPVKINIPIPIISDTSFIYDGEYHEPTISNAPNESDVTITGTTRAKNANEFYEITYALNDENKLQWEDGTSSEKTFKWTIEKAEGTLSLDSDSAVVQVKDTLEIFANKVGDGIISVNPQNSIFCDIEQVKNDETKFKFTGKKSGTGIFTFSVSDSFNYTTPEPKTFSLTVVDKKDCELALDKTSVTLNKNNLQEVVRVSRQGDGKISATSQNSRIAETEGSDTLIISAAGKGETSVVVKVEEDENFKSDEKIISVISETAGKSLRETPPEKILEIVQSGDAPITWDAGDFTAEFQLKGKIGDVDISGEYVFFILGFNHNQKLETENKNSIHFSIGKISDSRLLPVAFMSSDKENFLLDFYDRIPLNWRKIINSTSKYDENFSDDEAAKTVSKIFIPSVFEIFGNSTEKNYQEQYQFYKNGNSILRYDIIDEPVNYLTRDFYYVDVNAEIKTATPDVLTAVSPCFSVF